MSGRAALPSEAIADFYFNVETEIRRDFCKVSLVFYRRHVRPRRQRAAQTEATQTENHLGLGQGISFAAALADWLCSLGEKQQAQSEGDPPRRFDAKDPSTAVFLLKIPEMSIESLKLGGPS